MRNRILTLTTVLTVALAFPVAQAQPSESDLKALATVYSLTVVGSFSRDWCISRAPQTKAAVQSGYDGWLKDTKLNVITQKASVVFGSALGELKQSLETKREEAYDALDKAYPNPAQACQNFRAIMNSEMNPQKLYPAEYAAALKVQVSPAQGQTKPVVPSGAANSGNAATDKAQQDAADAEARRFKWVTAPGKGVQMNQIQTVLYHGESVYRVTGLQYEDSWVLLLKDGWAYRGLRVSPHDLDVKASRQNEPNQWFKWKLQGGKYYAVDPRTNQLSALKGTPATPAGAGEKLSGTFTYYSYASYGGFGGYSSQSHITFRPDGSFETSGSFIGGTGVSQSLNGFSSTASSTYSKDGCTAGSVSSSSNVGGGSTTRRDCGANNMGTYVLNGYTLELRYANGTTVRELFFFDDRSKKDVLIGSNLYQGK